MRKIDRKLFSELSNWLSEVDRKPLLIRGARQVGKSWAVAEWCDRKKLKLVTINFEEHPRYASIFEQDLDVNRIIDDIATTFGVSLRNPSTVLFLDEIQKAPKAITALRYFYEKAPGVIVIAAGSLIEFVLEEHGLPVGRVQSHFVHPLSFTEFLDAIDRPGLSQAVREFSCSQPKPFGIAVHQELLSNLKLYYKIGGMPKVLSLYISTRDIMKAAAEQKTIVQSYIDDFRKYAHKSDWTLLQTIFEKMGDLAGGASVKFTAIDAGSKSTQIRRALTALQHALIIHKILPTNASKLPLAAHAADKRFKLAYLDIGLLHSLVGFDWSALAPDADLTDIATGRFAEQFVAQEIIAARSGSSHYSLHCWEREQPGSEAEVDFIVEQNNRSVPVEVKSGAKGKLRSLHQYITELQPSNAFVLSQRNVEKLDQITFLPLYVASKL